MAANPARWLQAAAIYSAGSFIGAAIGYSIGYGLMTSVGEPIVRFYGVKHHWDQFVSLADTWGSWFLAAAAFTPIPFKVATIASGAIEMPFAPFLTISLFGRATRFFLVGTTLRILGPPVRHALEKHLDLAALLFFVLFVGGFLALRLF